MAQVRMMACMFVQWSMCDNIMDTLGQLKWLYYTMCPDFPGNLVYFKSYFWTTIMCVDYAGVLILLSVHINRFHCMQNIVIN